jgi:hypothetical protein
VRQTGGDVEGHIPFRTRFAVEDEEAEAPLQVQVLVRAGRRGRGRRAALPDHGEGDAEGHGIRVKWFSAEEQDVEGHMPRIGRCLSLEPTGEEEGGDPVYRVLEEGDDAEGHVARSGR